MKTVQINKVKVRIFEEDELREKLGMKQESIQLILEYQKRFPELLQEDIEGFIIDASNLHKQLQITKHLTQWLKPYIKDNNSYGFVEDVDFTRIDVGVNPTNGVSITGFKLTLEMAKQLCLVSKSEQGKLCRNYFILMEKTLRNYEKWTEIREPEKQEYNKMIDKLKQWCNRRNYDIKDEKMFKSFRVRESNMINENLTGKIASEIKYHLGYKDNITRDHLNEKLNSAILDLQRLNTNLLIADMDFDARNNIIKSICMTKYSNLHIE